MTKVRIQLIITEEDGTKMVDIDKTVYRANVDLQQKRPLVPIYSYDKLVGFQDAPTTTTLTFSVP